MKRVFGLGVIVAACGSTAARPAPVAPAVAPAPAALATTEEIDRIEVAGVVTNPDGTRAAGATVALNSPNVQRAVDVTRTASDGAFRFKAPADSYALTVTSRLHAAVYVDVMKLETNVRLDIALGEDGFRATGHVTGGVPAGTRVTLSRISDYTADLFYTEVDDSGSFAVVLPDANYTAAIESDQYGAIGGLLSSAHPQAVIRAGKIGPAAPEVIAWIKRAAIPIATADPEHNVADLEPLGQLVGDARVVALGEATHGTREFFQLKHRVLEYLVAKKNCTVFSIEANFPESLAVNEYVLTGKGDPAKALAGMYFWTWDTEEVRDLIAWMRLWNSDPRHKKKVQFLGFDMQTATVGAQHVLAYLKKVDATFAGKLEAPLAPLASLQAERGVAKLPAADQEALARAVADLVAGFDANKARWIKRSSVAAWALARQEAVVVAQAEGERRGGVNGFAWRDQSMAANIRWIAERLPRNERIFVWAHNGHVNLDPTGTSMGSHLARDFGKDYLTVGFVFDHGHFQAMGQPPAPLGLTEHAVGPATDDNLAAAFHAAGLPLLALDLRTAPEGPATDWLASPHAMREAGAVFSTETIMTHPVALAERFHAVIFVDETTRARPNPTGERKPPP